MDEAELIAAACSGDEDAFAELYKKHIRSVRAVCRSILRRNDVDDLCQDTFLLAFTRLRSFEGDSLFRTWITRIAVNQCLNTLRRARQPTNGDSHLVPMNTELGGEENIELERVSARLDLDRLLQVLSPGQRQILEMAYLEDMPELEIAETLGTSLSQVKSIILRAKRKVRKNT
jgi:RNA polymerase sigma-70 factor (ECF subfamily)